MDDVLEHLVDIIKVMEEIHRILKPSGKVEIIVPYYRSKNAFTDPTHKHFFTEKSMVYFTQNRKYNYSDDKFRIIKFEKYRNGFPFYHIKKYIGADIRLPIVVDTLRWILEVIK